jgi:hypothetical protein
MSNIATTWEDLVSSVDYLVKNQLLTEGQIRNVIDIVNIRTLVTHNKLNPKFINNIISPRVDNDFDDFGEQKDKIKMNEIYKLQKELNK